MKIIDAGAANLLAGLQIDQLIKLRSEQMTLDQLERFNNLTPEEREKRFGDWKRPTSVGQVKIYLRRLYEKEKIIIGETDGTETFASSGIFTGGIYGDTLPAGEGKPTPVINVAVYEMAKDGKYAELFESLGEAGKQELEDSQICYFCRVHPDKLRKDGFGTFFRRKGGFVADVYFGSYGNSGQLRVIVRPFSYAFIWDAKSQHRVISSQQELCCCIK